MTVLQQTILAADQALALLTNEVAGAAHDGEYLSPDLYSELDRLYTELDRVRDAYDELADRYCNLVDGYEALRNRYEKLHLAVARCSMTVH